MTDRTLREPGPPMAPRRLVTRLVGLARALLAAVVVLGLVLGGAIWQATRMNRSIDRLDDDVAGVRSSQTTMAGQVEDLKGFVDDLREVTPDEASRDQAITNAVHQVPEIRAILCEAFPGASACQAG